MLGGVPMYVPATKYLTDHNLSLKQYVTNRGKFCRQSMYFDLIVSFTSHTCISNLYKKIGHVQVLLWSVNLLTRTAISILQYIVRYIVANLCN
jgi:hypothetical protein